MIFPWTPDKSLRFWGSTSWKIIISSIFSHENLMENPMIFSNGFSSAGDVGFNMYFISSGSVILCSSSALQEVGPLGTPGIGWGDAVMATAMCTDILYVYIMSFIYVHMQYVCIYIYMYI